MFKDLILALEDKNDDLVEKLIIEIRNKQNIVTNKVNKISSSY